MITKVKMYFYVYAYLDPTNFYLPFYIGKGKGDRMYSHLYETYEKTENKKKWSWIKGIRSKGFEPTIIKWQENLSEEDAYELEEELIKRFGRIHIDSDGILTNICLGSRPPSALGRKRSAETRLRCSAARKGRKKGPMSAKHKAAISEGNKGKKHSDETIEKIRTKAIGRQHTVATRQVLSKKEKGAKDQIVDVNLPQNGEQILASVIRGYQRLIKEQPVLITQQWQRYQRRKVIASG